MEENESNKQIPLIKQNILPSNYKRLNQSKRNLNLGLESNYFFEVLKVIPVAVL